MPKSFIFKLEKVLDYRRQLEDEAVALLADAQAKFDISEQKKNDLESRLRRHQREGLKPDGTADDIWLWQKYKDGLDMDLSRAKVELSRLALKLQKCRQDAVERSKDRKLLEKLKEKQSTRHHHEENLKEQKESEELAALRHEIKDF